MIYLVNPEAGKQVCPQLCTVKLCKGVVYPCYGVPPIEI